MTEAEAYPGSLEPGRTAGFRLTVLERSVLALATVFLAGFFPWFPELHSPNELTRIYLANALVEDGQVSVDAQFAKHGRIFDASVRTVDGVQRYYSDKAPGVAFLALPVVALYDALSDLPATPDPAQAQANLDGKVRVARLFTITLPALLLLYLLIRYLAEHLADRRLGAILVLAYALGTVATPYSMLLIGHQLSALILFSLFLAVRRVDRASPLPRHALIGFLASAALIVEYQNVLMLLPFAVWYALRSRLRPLGLLAALAGAIPLVVALLAYHQAAFGSPFLTGYSFIASSFAEVHAQGLLGVTLPTPEHAFLSFLSPTKGLLFYAPWLALAVPGLFRHPVRGERRFTAIYVTLYALFVSAMVFPGGGWTVSQRHLCPMVPFLVLPVGLFIERFGPATTRLRHAIAVGLILPAIVACSVATLAFPYPPDDIVNPFWHVLWPLYSDGFAVPSMLSPLGVSPWIFGTIVIALALAIVFGDLVWRSVADARAAVATTLERLRSAAMPLLALAISAAWIAVANLPGADQDVVEDRAFIERVYVHDPPPEPAPDAKPAHKPRPPRHPRL
ncbi:MAG: hypothetical protein U1F43_25730 [Myxococcota bacterium]